MSQSTDELKKRILFLEGELFQNRRIMLSLADEIETEKVGQRIIWEGAMPYTCIKDGYFRGWASLLRIAAVDRRYLGALNGPQRVFAGRLRAFLEATAGDLLPSVEES